jgi:hypothetical protein
MGWQGQLWRLGREQLGKRECRAKAEVGRHLPPLPNTDSFPERYTPAQGRCAAARGLAMLPCHLEVELLRAIGIVLSQQGFHLLMRRRLDVDREGLQGPSMGFPGDSSFKHCPL